MQQPDVVHEAAGAPRVRDRVLAKIPSLINGAFLAERDRAESQALLDVEAGPFARRNRLAQFLNRR